MKVYFRWLFFLLIHCFFCGKNFAQKLSRLESELKKEIQENNLVSLKTAYLHNKIAKSYFKQKKYKKALENFEAELAIWGKLPSTQVDLVQKTKAYYNTASLHRLFENYSQSWFLGEKALKWSLQLYGEGHVETTDAYKLLADIAFVWNRPDLQLLYNRKALASFKQQTTKDSSQWVNLLVSEAAYYINSGLYEKGSTLLKKGLDIVDKATIKAKIEARLYGNLGVLYEYQDKHTEALHFYRKSLALQLANGGEKQLSVASLWDNMGIIFSKTGLYKKAYTYFEQAESLSQELLGIQHPKSLTILGHKASALLDLKEEDKAISTFEKIIIKLRKKTGVYCKEQIFALQKLASIAGDRNDYAQAITYAEKVNRIIQKQRSYPPLLKAKHYYNQAYYYQKKNIWALAKVFYLKSLNENSLKGVRSNTDGFYFSPLLFIKTAQALLELGINEQEGVQLIKEVNQVCKNSFDQQNFLFDKRDLLLQARSFHEQALLFLIQQPQHKYKNLITNCFVFSKSVLSVQRSSLQDLCNVLKISRTQQFAFQTALANERAYQKQWLAAEAEGNSKLVQTRFKWLQDAIKKRLTIQAKLTQTYPLLKQALTWPEALEMEDWQDQLDLTVLELHYFEGDEYLFQLVISAQEFELIKIHKNQIQNLSVLVKHLGSSKSDFLEIGEYIRLVGELSKILLPTNNRLKKCKYLSVYPDGQLTYLPFEILFFNTEQTATSYLELDYLLKHIAISYKYRWRISPSEKVKNFSESNSFLVSSPEYEYSKLSTLEPLKAAMQEVEALKKQFCVTVLGDYELEKKTFLKKIEQYNIIHLAMHAIAPDSGQAYLVLSNQNDTLQRLNFEEMTASSLNNCNLLVLSACQTGIGQYKIGEGVMSLGRAFAESGVRAELISLWSLSDQATKKIILNFYQNLQRGLAKDEALQQAKLNFLQKAGRLQAQPPHWAALVLWGSTKPIELPQKTSFFQKCFYLWESIGVLSLLLFIYFGYNYYYQ